MSNNTISVTSNIREFTRGLNDIAKRQIPYATSRALNDTAFEVRKAEIENAQKVFPAARKNIWTNQRTGFFVDKSNKQNLTAAVVSRAYFAQIQEEGGVKRPHSGKALGIPLDSTPKRIRRSDGIRMAKQDPTVFVNRHGVFKRQKSGKLKLLFTFTKQATVKPAFGFIDTGRKEALRRFDSNFDKRLRQALATAR